MQLDALDQPALEELAHRLGTLLEPGHIIGLEGPMGAGKTTFTRALGRGMSLDRPERVCSPTFNICVVHPGPIPLLHIDLYRLLEGASPAFTALGLEDLIDEASEASGGAQIHGIGAIIIEWVDLWKGWSEGMKVVLSRGEKDPLVRHLSVRPYGLRYASLLKLWLDRH